MFTAIQIWYIQPKEKKEGKRKKTKKGIYSVTSHLMYKRGVALLSSKSYVQKKKFKHTEGSRTPTLALTL